MVLLSLFYPLGDLPPRRVSVSESFHRDPPDNLSPVSVAPLGLTYAGAGVGAQHRDSGRHDRIEAPPKWTDNCVLADSRLPPSPDMNPRCTSRRCEPQETHAMHKLR